MGWIILVQVGTLLVETYLLLIAMRMFWVVSEHAEHQRLLTTFMLVLVCFTASLLSSGVHNLDRLLLSTR